MIPLYYRIAKILLTRVSLSVLRNLSDRRARHPERPSEVAFACTFIEFVEHDDRFFVVVVWRQVALRTDIEPERRSAVPVAPVRGTQDLVPHVLVFALSFDQRCRAADIGTQRSHDSAERVLARASQASADGGRKRHDR